VVSVAVVDVETVVAEAAAAVDAKRKKKNGCPSPN
jgi:hypothetical protein